MKRLKDNRKEITFVVILIILMAVFLFLPYELVDWFKKGPIKVVVLVSWLTLLIFILYKKWLKNNLLLITAGLFFLAFLILLLTYLKMISPELNLEARILGGITMLATTALAIITYSYANSTKLMAEEIMQQRYGYMLPVVNIREQKESGTEMIKKGLDIESGKIPEVQLCILENIGLGPAINISSFIRTPSGERRYWNFGTLAATDETATERLSVELKDGRGFLVTYYEDAYERPFESSREFIIHKEGRSYTLGPLRIRKLTEEEYSGILKTS